MNFLESDLEQIIFSSSREELSKRGLTLRGTLKRQVKIGNYGRADLVCFNRRLESSWDFKPEFTIIELKKEKISVSSFLQAVNYLKGVSHYISTKYPKIHLQASYKIVLIGKDVDCFSSFIYLPQILCSDLFTLELYTYSVDLDGLKFKSHNYYQLSNPGF